METTTVPLERSRQKDWDSNENDTISNEPLAKEGQRSQPSPRLDPGDDPNYDEFPEEEPIAAKDFIAKQEKMPPSSKHDQKKASQGGQTNLLTESEHYNNSQKWKKEIMQAGHHSYVKIHDTWYARGIERIVPHQEDEH